MLTASKSSRARPASPSTLPRTRKPPTLSAPWTASKTRSCSCLRHVDEHIAEDDEVDPAERHWVEDAVQLEVDHAAHLGRQAIVGLDRRKVSPLPARRDGFQARWRDSDPPVPGGGSPGRRRSHRSRWSIGGSRPARPPLAAGPGSTALLRRHSPRSRNEARARRSAPCPTGCLTAPHVRWRGRWRGCERTGTHESSGP